ncbi:MAG: acyl-CoA dehydrogenase [Chloroflexi bacterium]|nr:acyl-CoA dehydrogenase [Chloroflexota bacterium]
MNLGLSEEHEMLKKSARDLLSQKCPASLVGRLEESEQGYSSELWSEMASLGWLGLGIPEKYGGSGGNILDMVVLAEETGYAALPSPNLSSVATCGQMLLSCVSEQDKARLLPGIASGKTIFSLALIEPDTGWDLSAMATKASLQGGYYIITGTKMFVPYGHVADFFLCIAQVKGKSAGRLGLFLVDAKSPGIKITQLKAMGGYRLCEVIFSRVKAPAQNLLCDLGRDKTPLVKALQPGMVVQSAEMVGGAQKSLEVTLEYAKQRIQFGRPIGAFQAVQYKCTDMAKDLEGCRIITWAAAWKLSEGLPCAKDVAMAKFYANTACRRIAWEGHQVHAAAAFLKEHVLQMYTRRAMAAESNLGDSEFLEDLIAAEMKLTGKAG